MIESAGTFVNCSLIAVSQCVLLLLLLFLNNDLLFGVHCVEEGDRIPPLQSYGQALKQKDCFSGVLGDDWCVCQSPGLAQ